MNYHDDNYCRSCDTVVRGVKVLDEQPCLVLADTIFYAQGGGQKSDRGTLTAAGREYRVLKSVHDENGDPVLVTDVPDPAALVGQPVHCELDWEFRYTQMKLHTCLHLMHCLLQKQLGHELDNPLTSTIEADFAINKYKNALVAEADAEVLEQGLNALLAQDIEVTTWADENDARYRYWKCLDWVIPCGGIHVHNLREIGPVHLSSHTKKGNRTFTVTLG